jgi:hypothetical protein
MKIAKPGLLRMLPKIAFLALAMGALSGCVVVPLYPYHPWHGYYR